MEHAQPADRWGQRPPCSDVGVPGAPGADHVDL